MRQRKPRPPSPEPTASDAPQPGLIIKAQSGFFTVETGQGPVVCKLRGKLKQKKLDTDLVTVGDRVTVSRLADGTGLIESIEERTHALARRRPAPKGRAAHGETEHETIILANPDQAVFVFACAQPAPHLNMLDRFLVVAEANQIPVIICANKVDVTGLTEAQALFGIYERLGYTVIYTSAQTELGVPELRAHLSGRISALTGPSGVGKSSLLNKLQPGLGIAVKTVSTASAKGRHTTVHPELVPLDGGGWVADTPGIRALALHDIEPYEVDGYFPDIRQHIGECAYRNCTHTVEPGCGVRAAVARGEIDARRYDSFLRIRAGQVSAP